MYIFPNKLICNMFFENVEVVIVNVSIQKKNHIIFVEVLAKLIYIKIELD